MVENPTSQTPERILYQDRISKLANEILIGSTNEGAGNRQSLAFLHSNDTGRKIAALETVRLLNESDPTDEVRVALIIGTGSWQSLLPELDPFIDIFLFCDTNKNMPSWIDQTATGLEHSRTIDQYKTSVYTDKNGVLKDCPKATLIDIEDESYDEILSLGELYFLSSEERYTACRNTYLNMKAAGKKFIAINRDLTDVIAFQKLHTILAGRSKIIYADLTNAHDHIGQNGYNSNNQFIDAWTKMSKFEVNLRSLPFTDSTVIQYSEWDNELKAKVITGLDSYFT